MASRVLAWGLAAFVALAPLPFGAVGPGGRLFLELFAFVLVVPLVVAWFRRELPPPPRLAVAGIMLLLAVALAQAVPLGPPAGPPAPPGEGHVLGVDPATLDAPSALSVDPLATASALRTGAALAVVFLAAAATAAGGRASILAFGLLAGAAFQSLYGIAVLASGAAAIWGEPKLHYLDCATGSFVNRNHYAAYVVAGLAAGCGLAFSSLRRAHRERRPGAPLLSHPEAVRGALAACLAILALAGLLLSFSRAGIALGAASAGLASILGSFGIATRRTRAIFAAVAIAIAALPLASVGAARLAERYAESDEDFAAAGGRGAVWRDAGRLVAARPLLGSGFGGFAAAYPAVRSPGVRLHYSHAHNDAIQLAAEGGVVALVGLIAIVVALSRPWADSLRGRHGALAAAFACGASAFALHALVDFPFHVPGAAVAGVLLAGAIAGVPWSARTLTVVREDGSSSGRRWGLAAVVGALAAAGAATLLGADAARARSEGAALAAEAGRAALSRGADDPGARAALVELRRAVGARPRNAVTRARYAAALLDVAGESKDARDAAAFHAAIAADDAPVTVPVVASAARSLARAGEARRAIPLVRSMFAYDPAAAAVLLEELEGWLAGAAEEALPDLPSAWTARALSLRRAGRLGEGARLLEETVRQWPDDLDARRHAALVAAGEGRWDDLEHLLETGTTHPTLVALRARLHAHRGERERAIELALAAERASEGEVGVRELAARALLDAGDVAGARAMCERALWSLPTRESTRATRLRLAIALARLERDHGRPGDALRAWRTVLELDPSNTEARK